MADAKTSIVIDGKDNTAKAFSSVAAHASACGAQLKSILGGALAAAGVGLGFKGIYDGINELGHLSDIAQKTNTSVDDLTKTATAMNVRGIQRMGIDEFAKAMDYMQKTTGRVGMEGLYQTLEELGKIEDRAKRGQEAMRIFGRTGMEMMPLINAAETSADALRGVIDVMPAVTQSAADSGDACADAMAIASTGVKSIWLQALGAVCGFFDEMFVGGVREAALTACNWLEFYAKVGVTKVMEYVTPMVHFMQEIGEYVGALIGAFGEGAGFGEAFGMAADHMAQFRDQNMNAEEEEKASIAARQEAWRKAYEERQAKIDEFSKNYANAAKSAAAPTGGGAEALAKAAAGGASKRSAAIRNTLMLAGSNAAAKLEAFGPNYQTEAKKQTKLLEKIANNTAQSTDAAALEVVE